MFLSGFTIASTRSAPTLGSYLLTAAITLSSISSSRSLSASSKSKLLKSPPKSGLKGFSP